MKKFLAIYSTVLILAICGGLFYVWNLLIDYEASIPDVNMDKYLSEFSQDNIPVLLEEYPIEVNEYSTEGSLEEQINKFFNEGELSYAKVTGEYTNANPVYEICVGDSKLAKVNLEVCGKNGHGFDVWQLGEVDFSVCELEWKNVSISVPSSATVKINGEVIDDKYLVNKKPVELSDNISEFVDSVPCYSEYYIDRLTGYPDVTVEGDYIEPVTVNEGLVMYQYSGDEKLLASVSPRIRAMAQEYGKYIINKGELYLLKSYMVGKAKEYVSNIPAVWAYLWGEEYSYTFTNENIDNFVRLSEDCFSCDVSYVLNVYYRGTRNISYNTKISCMYVEKDGVWYLADFMLHNE